MLGRRNPLDPAAFAVTVVVIDGEMMMTEKQEHTPGPWKVFTVQDGPNKGQLLGIGQETGEGVTDAYGGLWGSGPEQMANARLIAAAPDLLETAEAFIADVDVSDLYDLDYGRGLSESGLIQRFRAAISRAKGGL